MKQIYICNDTITGIYSALYDAWKESRDKEAGIDFRGKTQQRLFCEYTVVEENERKAFQLERMVKKYLGYNAYWDIYHALLSDDERKGEAVFRVMQEARRVRDSRRIMLCSSVLCRRSSCSASISVRERASYWGWRKDVSPIAVEKSDYLMNCSRSFSILASASLPLAPK